MTWTHCFPKDGCVVINGDCREVLQEHGSPPTKWNMIFADPPYNIGEDYVGFEDVMDEEDYWSFTQEWISLCWDRLADGGVMCLHGNDNLAKMYLEWEENFDQHRIAWINWHYKFGQCSKSNWIDMRQNCLIYSKGDYTWNPESVLVQSDRVNYGDLRSVEGTRLPGTIWGLPEDGLYWGRVQGNNQERRQNHPNQLPEVYLKRLILAYTNEGDWVLDPFGGSGTTITVANALGRKCTTIEISEENCNSIVERIQKGAVRC